MSEGGTSTKWWDLRRFIAVLREHGALNEFRKEVDPVHELGALLHASEQSGKAALFHRVAGHEIPVMGSALGSHERIALALECEQDEIFDRVQSAKAQVLKPEQISAPAACQEVRRSLVDLSALPVPTHAPKDGGPYLNAGIVIARDPVGGRHNLTFIRMQVYGPDLVGVNINLWRDMREFFQQAEASGENLPFCAAFGVDPALLMAAAFRYDGDEYEIAGALRGAPVPVVQALTCEVLVPALAEIVMEGEVLAGERREEGPMAEFTGHYSGTTQQPVGRITSISHRKEPIFQTIAGASYEHLILGNALTREPLLDTEVRKISPRVKSVHLPPFGSGFTAIVSLGGPRPGEPISVGIAALSSHVNIKTVVLVDEDVDIFQPAEVAWALSTRVRWDRDCVVIPGAQGNDLDPSSDAQAVQAKVLVDATLGDDRKRSRPYERVRYPTIDVREFLGGTTDPDAGP